jgi:glyoxylase-like metal-dependent hydrolase (beta-lactamase superfamily II)
MRIEMLNLGWMTAPAGLWRQGDEDPKRPLRLPVPAYLIESGSERILIDTGLHPDAVTNPDVRYGEGTALGNFGLEQERGLAEQIDLGTLTRLVLTHLHFDHAGGLELIPESVPVVLQRAEWEAAHDRAGVERNFFQPADYADAPSNLTLIEGDHDLLGDGSIMLLSTPGHTSGHQSVRIGDLVLGADEDAQVKSAERLRKLRDAGLTIQPGHDPDVLRPGPVTA